MTKPMKTADKQLATERQAQIRALLRNVRVLRIEPLCEQLGASPATIRRDLAELEKLGALRRVYGGAVSVESRLDEPLFDDKTALAAREKFGIAEAAARLILEGETVYLDGGSTVLDLARQLRDRTDITVVTNSLRAAQELAGQGPRLLLIGGELRRRSQTVVGPLSRFVLQELHVDKAFMGTIGFSIEQGMTTTDHGEAFTKQMVMKQASSVILLMDSTKVGKVAFARAGSVEDIQILITDKQIDPGLAARLKKKHVEVIKAG